MLFRLAAFPAGLCYQRNASASKCLYFGLLYMHCQVPVRERLVYNMGGPSRCVATGIGFREGFPTAVNASASKCLYSRFHLRWWHREAVFAKDRTMKRYICIVIVVSGALLSSGNGGWSISNNSISVIINAADK